MSASKSMSQSLRRATATVAKGFFDITHNSIALVGVTVIFIAIALFARPELRELGEVKLFGWLQERQAELTGMVKDPVAVERATATNNVARVDTASWDALAAGIKRVRRGCVKDVNRL